ncbi:MAG: hypothetical protein IANPNBLG_04729 [Bryobacteraceae bacterium]|nr:hypothetical protein [Bryobacteraceae bacterium]
MSSRKYVQYDALTACNAYSFYSLGGMRNTDLVLCEFGILSSMRYLEDLTVGERILTRPAKITEAEILTFARQFDPQPMHVDREAAHNGPLGGLSASGWHTAAIVMRLIVDADPLEGVPWLGLGVDELRWPNPVRPGDTITVEIEVVSVTPSRSKPSHGIVRTGITARNQKDEVVMTLFPNLWIPRRPL